MLRFQIGTWEASQKKWDTQTHSQANIYIDEVEVQKSNLCQKNLLKAYYLTSFMQYVQKLNMVGFKATNVWAERCRYPCMYLSLENYF